MAAATQGSTWLMQWSAYNTSSCTTYCIRNPYPSGCVQGGSGRGLTSSEVLNDEATSARVCLRGHVNGEPFTVERTIKRCSSSHTALFGDLLD